MHLQECFETQFSIFTEEFTENLLWLRGHLIKHIQANVSTEKNTTHGIDNFNNKIQ